MNLKGAYRAFLTGPNGTGPLQDLGIIPGPRSSDGFAVNDNGRVTGRCWTNGVPTDPYIAFISGSNGTPLQQLPNLGGGRADARGMNANGEIVGGSPTANDTPSHAFVTGPNGKGIIDLGTLGGLESFAWAINNLGQITGGSEYGARGYNLHPFFTSTNGGPMKDLGTLGGEDGRGFGINNLGQVTGSTMTTPGGNTYHAFVSAPNGGPLTDLSTLGGNLSNGYGVNDYGVVVGYSHVGGPSSDDHGFVATPGMGMQDLNSLIDPATGFIIHVATAINNWGQIAANGENAAGFNPRAVLLTPRYLEVFYQGIKEFSRTDKTFTVQIDGFAPHSYQLQRNTSLDSSNWEDVGSPVVAMANGPLHFVDSDTASVKMFYRVVLTP